MRVRRLLITADVGVSNSYRYRLWKAELAVLAAETGPRITVCQFPPGTSKWNKIEHRPFSQITLNWRGRPLTTPRWWSPRSARPAPAPGCGCTPSWTSAPTPRDRGDPGAAAVAAARSARPARAVELH